MDGFFQKFHHGVAGLNVANLRNKIASFRFPTGAFRIGE
jgi:hypothetical protein